MNFSPSGVKMTPQAPLNWSRRILPSSYIPQQRIDFRVRMMKDALIGAGRIHASIVNNDSFPAHMLIDKLADVIHFAAHHDPIPCLRSIATYRSSRTAESSPSIFSQVLSLKRPVNLAPVVTARPT